MISLKDFYNVLAQVIPLYVAMILAYGSVKWWKIFSLDQCSGINRFVALFAVPLLSFHFISTNNPYEMNFRFIAADTLQKIIVLIFLFLWAKLSSRGSLEWSITLFSLSTLPNTLVMGIPLLAGMYGKDSSTLMVQIVVLQCIIWYTIMLFLFEFRGARMLISEQFPDDKAGLIKTFKVDSDVVSLHDKDNLETESQVGEDGKLHVRISRSTSSRSENLSKNSDLLSHTPSNLSNVEIYSIPSKRFYENNNDGFYSFVHGSGKSYLNYNGSLKNQSNGNLRFFDEEKQIIGGGGGGDGGLPIFGSKRFARVNQGGVHGGYPAPSTTGIFSPVAGPSSTIVEEEKMGGGGGGGGGGRNDLHGFVRSSSASVFAKGLEVYKGNADYDHNGNGIPKGYDDNGKDGLLDTKPSGPSLEIEGPILSTCFARSTSKVRPESEAQCGPKPKAAPPAIAMTKLILIMIWRKLIRNPNTYSSVIGLAWSLISFRFHVQMPKIVANSISILSNTGLGMAMFSLGLFMALQPRIIAGGNAMAAYAAVVRFIIGPASMAATSAIVGLRGTLLQIAIVQAALPQGIVPFVFAKEYNVHPDILSTAVIFGMLIALPIALVYYILLGLIK